MTSSTPTKTISNPALLVFGKPTSADLPQASWFLAEDRPTVIAAAQILKFSVLDIQTDADRSLFVGVHEGVLEGAGRMIVGSVTAEVYQRIEGYAAKASGALAVKASTDTAAGSNSTIEQNKNIRAASEQVESAGALRIGGNLILVLRRLGAARDGTVVCGLTQEGGFGDFRTGHELSRGGAAVRRQFRQRDPMDCGFARAGGLRAAAYGRRPALASRRGARRLPSWPYPARTGPDADRNPRPSGARARGKGVAIDDLAVLRSPRDHF